MKRNILFSIMLIIFHNNINHNNSNNNNVWELWIKIDSSYHDANISYILIKMVINQIHVIFVILCLMCCKYSQLHIM